MEELRLFSHYLNSDLLTAGLPAEAVQRFLSPGVDPREKWTILKPWWPAVKNTGYAQAVRIAIRELYGVDELSDATAARVQEGYEKLRRPGFYRRVLRDQANIESCQVNCLTGEAFKESEMPTLLMQDISLEWTNAHLDMCWSWIINPVAAKDFLKKYLVTAPANKVLPFGADYIPVEPVLGHAVMARRGVAQALSELVAEGWLSLNDAMGLVDPILHGNARRLFDLEAKTRRLAEAPWAQVSRTHPVLDSGQFHPCDM